MDELYDFNIENSIRAAVSDADRWCADTWPRGLGSPDHLGCHTNQTGLPPEVGFLLIVDAASFFVFAPAV
ncbi:hypothetical protein A5769_15065 [Mycobacterium intracellulare]|nr:hypothetical protein A5769_15065 [Mycobacterium intracellulare]